MDYESSSSNRMAGLGLITQLRDEAIGERVERERRSKKLLQKRKDVIH